MSVGALVTSAPPADPKAPIRLCPLCFKPVKGGVPGVSSHLVEETPFTWTAALAEARRGDPEPAAPSAPTAAPPA